MKRLFISIFIFFIPFICFNSVFAQCTPDTVHCKDILQPGEICPRILPDGYINKQYNEVFTVIPPSTAQTQYGPVDLVKIVIDTVGNLPPGLNYTANSDTFWIGTAYCVLLSGKPLVSGKYDLKIRVIPYIYSFILGIIKGDPVVDDTSLTITIYEQAGLEDFSGVDFAILDAIPNPFRDITKLGFFIRSQDYVELWVYNLLGQLVYSEMNFYPPGKHYFHFNGMNLQSGTYIYRISNSSKSITRKLIRTE